MIAKMQMYQPVVNQNGIAVSSGNLSCPGNWRILDSKWLVLFCLVQHLDSGGQVHLIGFEQGDLVLKLEMKEADDEEGEGEAEHQALHLLHLLLLLLLHHLASGGPGDHQRVHTKHITSSKVSPEEDHQVQSSPRVSQVLNSRQIIWGIILHPSALTVEVQPPGTLSAKMS